RRQAFDRAIAGDDHGAVQILRAGLDSVTDDLERGWYMEELSTYEHFVDEVASQRTLASARALNDGVLKPSVSPQHKKITGPAAQGTNAAEYLAAHYTDGRQLQLKVGSLFDNIVWGVPQAADRSEAQIRELGLHLGFASTR